MSRVQSPYSQVNGGPPGYVSASPNGLSPHPEASGPNGVLLPMSTKTTHGSAPTKVSIHIIE
jgi:hypothetical protein